MGHAWLGLLRGSSWTLGECPLMHPKSFGWALDLKALGTKSTLCDQIVFPLAGVFFRLPNFLCGLRPGMAGDNVPMPPFVACAATVRGGL